MKTQIINYLFVLPFLKPYRKLSYNRLDMM